MNTVHYVVFPCPNRHRLGIAIDAYLELRCQLCSPSVAFHGTKQVGQI